VFHTLYFDTEGTISTANMGLSDFVKKATTVVEKGVDQVADSLSVHPYLETPHIQLTSGDQNPPIVIATGIVETWMYTES